MLFLVAISQAPKSFIGLARFFRVASPTCYSILSDHLKNRRIDEAKELFERIPSPNIYLCTKMIAGYAENLRLNEALKLFDKMPVKDTVMRNLMIKGCVDCGDMEMGLKLFEEMTQRNVISYTTMINRFLKFGKVEEAESLFWEMPQRDVTAWNAMIYGYFENGRVEEAVKLIEDTYVTASLITLYDNCMHMDDSSKDKQIETLGLFRINQQRRILSTDLPTAIRNTLMYTHENFITSFGKDSCLFPASALRYLSIAADT
ncbi:hypothetical protein K7X08_017944 [Anisodus acutangulus]|uniref:Pentatricopeptide repeat-containing protein n=1 Tax=Anisodus acutangulus TaxID=402998 RepID=A0A9Q1LUQ8_9SOLA|nr:hypothetical protein K7X08_017944 [Anisodus acutangulus]